MYRIATITPGLIQKNRRTDDNIMPIAARINPTTFLSRYVYPANSETYSGDNSITSIAVSLVNIHTSKIFVNSTAKLHKLHLAEWISFSDYQ